ncbi:MAG: glucose/arabinose dehydrogenase [Planctomycetota bacterium]|jgi:glucose/arabinose dehydrogenase
MRPFILIGFVPTLFLLASSAAAQISVTGAPVANVPQRPVTLAAEPGNPSRLYAPNKLGRIYLIENGVLNGSPFMDLSAQVNETGEGGMLGMALHPDYANNGKFYLSYCTGMGLGDSIISEFTTSTLNPNEGDPASEQIIFGPIAQTTDGHKGGDLHFGPDGMLYFSMGDGWAGGLNVDRRAQDITDPRGSILRFDVDIPFPHVPADNPFVGVAGADERIWVLGLRNPWRFGVDSLNGDLLIGDVGQSTWEELNWVPGSAMGPPLTQLNFGWPCKEGSACYGGAPAGCNCGTPAFRDPVVEYAHASGCAITGGTTYRGSAIPALYGYHVYSDFCTGTIWAKEIVGGVVVNAVDLSPQFNPMTGIVAITADADGELYIIQHYSGQITKIVPDCGGTNYCSSNPNSTGATGKIAMQGSSSVAANGFVVTGYDLPPAQFAYIIASKSQGFFPNVGSSQGNLCIQGDIGRFKSQVGAIDAQGIYSRNLDLTSFPTNPAVAVAAGDTWNFQVWHRDAIPMITSNFTEGLSVVFCP